MERMIEKAFVELAGPGHIYKYFLYVYTSARVLQEGGPRHMIDDDDDDDDAVEVKGKGSTQRHRQSS